MDIKTNENLFLIAEENPYSNNELKYKHDSRNRKPFNKRKNTSRSTETFPTNIISANSQTMATENCSNIKTIQNEPISDNNLQIRRRRKRQQTVFQPKNNEIIIIYDILFHSDTKQNSLDFNKLRYFIINHQKKVNSEYDSFLKESMNTNDDSDKVKKLETLISRYSIVIFYLLKKKKFEEAKKILLLMIKENIHYLDYHSHKLFKIFNKLQQKYEILKVYPKQTKELFKIYSFIIKYCDLFKLTKHKNKFLVRYLALQSLNYKVFKRKIEMHGFNAESRNQIKYWFAICLHNASYFAINAYCPPRVPIAMSGLILKLYRNLDENLSTRQERSLLINTSYNQGILYYINNQPELALRALKLTKQKIMSFHDNDNNGYNNVNKVFQFVDQSKINGSIAVNNKNSVAAHKNSLVQNYFLGLNTKELLFNKRIRNYSFASSNDFVEQVFINEGKKKSLKMEDISEIFFLNLNLNENVDPIEDYSFLNKKTVSPFPSIRGSQSDFDKFLKTKEFNIPKYIKEPLFFNIELLMTEIELDRKNYNLAYEHVKNCIILILVVKQLGDSNKNNNINNFHKELNIMSEFLEIIEKNNKDKKLYAQIKSLKTINIRLSLQKGDKKLKKSTKVANKDKNNPTFDKEKTKMEKEIEKFFIFLNSLSVYQIKLLNDTQPANNTRNDLPIFFSNQFKDTLSSTQRINLEKLNIMSLSRCIILNDPNNYILPSNLVFRILNQKKKIANDKISDKNNSKINDNNNFQISFNGSLMNNDYNENEEDKELESDFRFSGTEELKNFKKIVFSKNCNKDLKLFFLNNFLFAISILKKSEPSEIQDMIDYPEIMIEPIKRFKRKNKDKVKYINENKQEIFKHLILFPEFKELLDQNSSFFKDEKEEKIIKPKKKSLSSSFSNENMISISNYDQPEDINNNSNV